MVVYIVILRLTDKTARLCKANCIKCNICKSENTNKYIFDIMNCK